MKHHLSFDVEDVYQGFKERGIAGWSKDVYGEKKRINEILDMLDKHNQKATFFVLTEELQDYKQEALEMKKRGHEVASHGHEHLRIWRRNESEFSEDIKRSKDLLEGLISSEVKGYRAPGFSLNKSTLWAVDLIQNAGFTYSSSSSLTEGQIPLNLSIPTSGNLSGKLIEFPATSFRVLGVDARICGGFYFRALPLQITKLVMRRQESMNKPTNLYLHPFEFEDHPVKIKSNLKVSVIRYHNTDKTKSRLEQLLQCYSFTSFEETLSRLPRK